MPLLDHFHAPLFPRRHWHSFHNSWATFISSALNRLLPAGYFAEANVQFNIEIDVAAFEDRSNVDASTGAWTSPAPALTVPLAALTDIVEVAVYETSEGLTLTGVIELVSPSNKDRPASRMRLCRSAHRTSNRGSV
jgi:hypothetical protein